jgi:hypothetical protein
VVDEVRKILGYKAVELTAVLPLIAGDYVDDFEETGSEEQFNDLLGQFATTVVLAKHKMRSKAERDAAYERAGRYIVDRSDVLIAVWDGREPGGRGGTADIVAYARERDVPVLVVPAQRREGEDPLEIDDRAPLATPRFKEALEAFERIEEYNEASPADAHVRTLIDETRARLAAPVQGSAIHWKLEFVADWAGAAPRPRRCARASPPEVVPHSDVRDSLPCRCGRGPGRHAGCVRSLAMVVTRGNWHRRRARVRAPVRASGSPARPLDRLPVTG